ncbi:MAG: hypothetical protein HDS88_07780 [Bacteroidales bacterium]|nr:hypothetical protein [Bacteroidales bacterium]MBD5246176.1 hypothetical protein [Barnesiella sp.]
MKKRDIKKEIRRTCGTVACEAIFAASLINGVNKEAMQKPIIDAAVLQESSLKKISVAFDKTPRDFSSRKEYNKARRQYFKKVFGAIRNEFGATLQEIVTEMNGAMPKK